MFQKIKKHFQIESVGYYFDRVFSKDFDFKGESHNFIEIVYVCSGNVRVVENENVYILNSGDMILHAPMEFHRIKSDAQTAPHVLNLSLIISGEPPKQLFDGVFHLSPEQHQRYIQCFQLVGQLLHSQSSHPYLSQQVADELSAFFAEISQRKTQGNDIATDGSALLYRKLVQDMQKSVYLSLSLEELAKQNFVSVSYIKKLFRMYANITPKHFYDDLRIKEAMLLLKTRQPVAEIADKMGFSSPNFFSVFFKKHVGITPSEYRKTEGFLLSQQHRDPIR